MFSKKIHYIPPKDSIQNTVYSIQNTVYRIQYTEYSIQIKVKIKNSLKLNSESRIMSTDFHISILTFYFKKSRIFYIIENIGNSGIVGLRDRIYNIMI